MGLLLKLVELGGHATLWLLCFPIQGLVYSLFTFEDQVLNVPLCVVVLSDLRLGLLSLCLRTKYQTVHTEETLSGGADILSVPRYSFHLYR